MCCSLLLGTLLMLWGLSVIINIFFHIHIPVFGIIFGIFLIYIGIQILVGPSRSRWRCWSCDEDTASCRTTFMGSFHTKVNDDVSAKGFPLEYKTVFGNSTIDLSTITLEKLKSETTPVIVNTETTFGKAVIILNKSVPTRIIAKSSFGKIMVPDTTTITFGSYTYNSHPNEQPLIIINCSTNFGDTEFRYNE